MRPFLRARGTPMDVKKLGFDTRAIHAGQEPDPVTGAVVTPISLATTFLQDSPGQHRGYEYARSGNPTRKAYEDCLASVESGQFGLAFASGCVALTTILHLLKQGDHLISMDDIYGGSIRLMNDVFQNKGIQTSFVDLTDLNAFEKAISEKTRMVWLETPTNPTMKLVDIEQICQIAKAKNILVAVDNTFMSPVFQRPLELGADITYHSTSKYIGGHSDVIGGAIVVKDKDLADQLYFLQNAIGGVPSPFECFLCLRSLKTLAIRMKGHDAHARRIASFLEGHPKVERVLYPGLSSHPQYLLAQKQMSGFGGMISFYLKGGLKQAKCFLEKLQIFALAESLGGVESLIEHPAIMTHASVPSSMLKDLEITDNLIRMSVGLENTEDLIADLKQALQVIS